MLNEGLTSSGWGLLLPKLTVNLTYDVAYKAY